jgi:hypothetical protein
MPEQMAQCLETKIVSHQCAESPISALSTYHHHMASIDAEAGIIPFFEKITTTWEFLQQETHPLEFS